MTWRVEHGECVEAMRAMPEASVDAIVTDPPYGLEFMGKEWDRLVGEHSRGGNHAGVRAGNDTPYARRENVVYNPGPNPTCRACGGLKYLATEGSGGRKKCACASPDFPNYKASAARAMQAWHEAWALEALRVLKPGGHLLAFGGTRTYHRLTCALEDAGFEVRDCLMWLYGTGFPKSHNVSKAIDKAAGVEREVVGQSPNWRESKRDREKFGSMEVRGENAGLVTKSATPEAVRWEGWGTALKPAWEPIVLARKPLVGTVATNVLEHGTGALNIDDCKVATDENLNGGAYAKNPTEADDGWRGGQRGSQDANSFRRGGAGDYQQPAGRWPANVVLDDEAAALLDEQTGNLPRAGGKPSRRNVGEDGRVAFRDGWHEATVHADAGPLDAGGGPSRFFYCAKPGTKERNAGLDGKNGHPTVKPIDLMRWLVRLVTPPGGVVLDPFTGSGTTGIATILEGFEFVGVELDESYVDLARARIAHRAAEPTQLALGAA